MRDALDEWLGKTQPQRAEAKLKQMLLEAGLLSEIKPPITDLTPYRNRRAVPIQGEPISETDASELMRQALSDPDSAQSWFSPDGQRLAVGRSLDDARALILDATPRAEEPRK